jgi:hypothetical protein
VRPRRHGALLRGPSTSPLGNMVNLVARLLLYALVVAFAASPGSASADSADACRAQLRPSLVDALKAAFPKFRAPLMADNYAEDIDTNRKSGGTGCLGVDSGDYDGDGTKDFAVVLTGEDGDSAVVVAALQRGKQWVLKTLVQESGRKRLYVQTVPPDHYDATGSSEDPKETGGLETVTCPHSGILTGTTESTGVIYCLVSGSWKSILVAD